MEDQVAYKVYAFWKDSSKPEVRRFGMDKTVVSSYTYLLAKIHDVFPNLKENAFSICWKDEEGDDVKISSDDEIMTMMTTLPQQLFKLYVYVENTTDGVNPPSVNVACAASPRMPFVFAGHAGHAVPGGQPGHPGLHTGVRCDNCNRGVVGFRYKCISCEDFDLCSACEVHGAHSQHCFVRIPSPHMSPQVVIDSIKKSRHVLKTFAARLFEAQKKHAEMAKAAICTAAAAATGAASASGASAATMPQRCSSKSEAKLAAKERREERREERQEKRQEKHEKRQERRMEDRRERREHSHDRPSWVDVFSKYIDQFANLAADHVRVVTSTEQTSQTAETVPVVPIDQAEFNKIITACMALHNSVNRSCEMSGQEGASQETEDSTQAPTAKPASAPQMAPNQAPNTPEAPTQGPTIQQGGTQAPKAPQGPTQAPITPQVPTTAPVMPQVAPNPVTPVEDPKADMSDASSVSSAEETSRDSSPDKSAEDWTMINNYKELETDTGATNLVQIDSNLPEEFQLRPGGAYGFIYPALNAATAEPVVIPEKTEPAAAPTQAPRPVQPQTRYTQGFNNNLPAKAGHGYGPATYAASMGQATTSETPPSAPVPPPSAPVVEERQHRVPHIDAAIRQMITMGFTNEGGWLTQLVESKDGNIAAVLDLLTPVQPPKK